MRHANKDIEHLEIQESSVLSDSVTNQGCKEGEQAFSNEANVEY